MTGFLESLLGNVLGGPVKADRPVRAPDVPMLAHWLPYRSYDPASGLYFNSGSRGFVLEVSPLIGADERTGEIIGQFLSEGIPQGACIQIMHWASPRVADALDRWYAPRYASSGVYEQIARHRCDHLHAGVWESLSADAPFHLRTHKVFISLAVPEGSSVANDELVSLRDAMSAMLKSIELHVRAVEPAHLLALIDDLTSPTTASGEDPTEYNPFDSIADQAVRRDMEIRVEPERLILRTERFRASGQSRADTPAIGEIHPDSFDVRSFAVRNLPKHWAPWDSVNLIGDLFSDKLRMPCPVATVLCIEYPDEQKQAGKASYKFMRTTSLTETRSVRFMPTLRDQSREWEYVQDQMRAGQKLVRVFFGVTSISPLGKGDTNERAVKAVFKGAGWDLLDERYMQIPSLMSIMPMAFGNGLARDYERLRRMRTMLTSTAAHIAPMQGEFNGGPVPHMLLIGRRGQPFFWSPFENNAGNHNVAVIGKSGSGKSVFLQELTAAMVGAGSKLIVIDDGRSFEHSAKLQGGDFIEFTMSSGFCLNPFSMIDRQLAGDDEDYRLDAMGMLKAIIAQMARHMDRLDDTERGLIDGAVNLEWDRHGSDGSIDGVIAALEEDGHPRAKELAISMRPFSSAGTYGAFFKGRATVRIDANLTVFELSDLAAREELRNVVLTAIMFLSTKAMRADRSTRKALLIDEAWQLLKGGAMAEFVETYARTCRKYGSALITATQSLNDYYAAAGSKAALENSDWFAVLQQKPETIADFSNLQRFDMRGGTEALMRSLKRSGGDYSEVMIKGPDSLGVGRLVLDPYSSTIFSSSPQVFARIEALVAGGHSLGEAIEQVAFPDDPGKWRAQANSFAYKQEAAE
ncbi:conjugal transfer ATP-binding protein TraC [Sphingobium sp. B1D7B]|uniref:type IV secretion system protein TraC n=1 Tax=Sphingobium sp. B1D7B TaxID=2940578 RepID=UPI002224F177|nr:type IV secretion system protein TraC [Sphingobium sp. B1D7B]MCW2406890.1 conjugal transfer ATP-binding protein TraC [Sphingobium sp. B1D7B]